MEISVCIQNKLLKNAVFWDVTTCGSFKNRSFEGSFRQHPQGEKNQRARNNVRFRTVLQLIVNANVNLKTLILFTLMVEEITSY
jgi:hypothetical protein